MSIKKVKKNFIRDKNQGFKKFPKLRKYAIYLLLSCIVLIFSKKLFLMLVFIAFTLFVKFLKTLVAMPITPEPVVFFSLVFTMEWGIQYTALFLFLTVIIFDLIIGRFNDSTFVAFVLILAVSALAIPLKVLNIDFFLFGVIMSFIYMVAFIMFRTKVLGIQIVDVLSPAVSCFIFNFLYFSLLSPVLRIIM